MHSVADDLRREDREAELRLTPAERVERALALGDADLEIYCAATSLDREAARRRLQRQRQVGRIPCSFFEEPDE